jgi:F-type H+-transporting ATPase subunit b
MLIDWFTVGAQTLNFAVLVWLMKRFLYKPILDAIDARETKIAAELADADAKKAEAKKERDEFESKNNEFDQQRATLLSKATDDAKAEHTRLLDEARKAADAMNVKRQEMLKNEFKNLHESIYRSTQREVFSIARKALTDLAESSLEERMTDVFIRRLQSLDAPAKTELAAALKAVTSTPLLRSAFALPTAQRETIQQVLKQNFSTDIAIQFDTVPDLIGGIELSVSGKKVSWNIANYLAVLESSIASLLKDNGKGPDAKAIPHAEKTADQGTSVAEPKEIVAADDH